MPSPACCRRRSMTSAKSCAPETVPPAIKLRRCSRSTRMKSISPPNVLSPCASPPAPDQDVLRLLRHYSGDIGLTIRLSAPYGSMMRTSLPVHPRLMRVQPVRQNRNATEGAACRRMAYAGGGGYRTAQTSGGSAWGDAARCSAGGGPRNYRKRLRIGNEFLVRGF